MLFVVYVVVQFMCKDLFQKRAYVFLISYPFQCRKFKIITKRQQSGKMLTVVQ
jgi:hypothetical protein